MASERDIFDKSGPKHLTHIDWENSDHRRSVAASLVQGVYVLERDRQQNRLVPQSLAPPWWDFFHFQLIRQLIDDADLSIFGAIYEFKAPNPNQNHFPPSIPKFVIAFRGTITKPESFSRDLKLDLQFLQSGLHRTSRFELAMQAVRNAIATARDSNHVWLSGHSLGSAIAMLAGKNMARTGVFLESFLFNPPFFSAPIEKIKDTKVKHGIRVASSLIAAGLAVAVKGRREREESFSALSAWVPYLFVNPADHICSEYVGYFEHRSRMEEIGAGGIERLATQNSVGGLVLSAFGRESEPLHLIPSANLTVNLSPSPDFKRAHGIHQWWGTDVHLQCKQYHYK